MTTAAMAKTIANARTTNSSNIRRQARRRPAALGRARSLDADALCEQLAVVRGVAQKELGGLGPLEVQVGGVLPGEPDAAVDLDVLGGGMEVRVGAVGLGQ